MTENRAIRPIQVRAVNQSIGKGIVTGYAGLFNARYNVDGTTEVILPGAFRSSLARNSTVPVFNGDWKHGPIGHAYVNEDAKGLRFRAQLYLDESPMVRRIYKALAQGALSEWQAAMLFRDVEHDRSNNYVIHAADLLSISPTVKGNAPSETIEVRRAIRLGIVPKDKIQWVLDHIDSPVVRGWVRELMERDRLRRRGLAA